MSRVAIATCRGDQVDPDGPLLVGALGRLGVEAVEHPWDDPAVDWDAFDLTVIRSTWDYASRRDEFLAWARSVARLENPYDTVRFSSDKHYLAGLEAKGVRIVPSRFVDVGREPEFFEGDFVVKPAVGAGSIGAARYGSHEHARALVHVASLHREGRDVLVQPYVAAIDARGERALIYLDGAFSHAMTKAALLNVAADERDFLYRREQMSLAEPESDALVFAGRVLEAAGAEGLLYARVDLVHDGEGWMVMELELVEPSLFLGYRASAAEELAAAIRRRVA